MNIVYDQNTQTFHLSNKFVSYVIAVEEDKYLSHYYWGKKIKQVHSPSDYPRKDRAFAPNPDHIQDRHFSLATLPQEYSGTDIGDFRVSSYTYTDITGLRANHLNYHGYSIFNGKKTLQGLPHTYVKSEQEAMTLEIQLIDSNHGMSAFLQYTIFEDHPVVTRSVRFQNNGEEALSIKRAMSMSIDLPDSNYDFIQFPGAWGREREVLRSSLVRGIHTLDSKRGTTSHTYQPFLALVRKDTDEFSGEAYGFHLIYSGEFLGNVEVDSFSQTRVQLGINPEHFEWKLGAGETFQTPEVVMSYSEEGLNGMSRSFHELYQNKLIRGKHQYRERPVLINNWEGTYFNFTEEKILNMAEISAELGIELFVLDDGWFGKRDDDYSSLGDWTVYKNKLPNGLKALSDAIHKKGMKFGLWFEPEMVSEDSDLYRSHPDWCIHTPGIPKSRGRSQLVLDFSRKEVRDNILSQMKAILDEVPIDYIKWDYNRNMTELGSAAPEIMPGEVAHRYILGLYEMLEDLVTTYPDILFESCSGGGGRYDPGMLYYMPQTWTSDNTDAASRLEIQYGTSMMFPISSMGSHVSDVPNHQVNRYSSLEMRGHVAMSGNLGYELDVTKLTEPEKEAVREQISWYKSYRKLIQFGNFYRILSPYDNKQHTAWIFVDQNKETAIYFYYQIIDKANKPSKILKMTGLDSEKTYQLDDGRILGGDELMYRGIYLDPDLSGDYKSRCIVLHSIES